MINKYKKESFPNLGQHISGDLSIVTSDEIAKSTHGLGFFSLFDLENFNGSSIGVTTLLGDEFDAFDGALFAFHNLD
jgi:hypothetical protein